MRRLAAMAVVPLAVCLLCGHAFATGTPAGTDISNQATATYTVAGTPLTQNSNIVTTRVAELLDVNVVWQDAAPVPVNPGAFSEALTFLLTNTGNGTDSYTLQANSVLGGDDFDPTLVDLYLDVDGNGVFNVAVDQQYIPGANDPALPADGSITVFILCNIPGGLADGSLGNGLLTAISNTGTGVPGTVVPSGGENGTDAVIGSTSGRDDVIGTYVVAAAAVLVEIIKSATVTDPFGGVEPVPGATISYTITVTATGTGTAEGLSVTDAIPANTTYDTGTLSLDGNPLTDAADADAGDVGDTTPGTVTVDLGDVAAGSPGLVIAFSVIID